MKMKLYRKERNNILNLFFAGWGMDENPFDHLVQNLQKTEDLCICFDYNDLTFQYEILSHYKEIRVFGWSFGVWVASVIFPEELLLQLNITSATAINGTPWPIDDYKGIPESIFNGTMNSLSEDNLVRFNRRMCGIKENRDFFETNHPKRNFDSLYMELKNLGEWMLANNRKRTLKWTNAVIGEKDQIFPFRNQLEMWKEVPSIITPDAHYAPWIPFLDKN